MSKVRRTLLIRVLSRSAIYVSLSETEFCSSDWRNGCRRSRVLQVLQVLPREIVRPRVAYSYVYHPTVAQAVSILHICHFFYTDRILENQILHPKKRLKAPKTLKKSLKSQIYAFFSLNLEKFTPDRKFLHRHRLWCLWQIWGMNVGEPFYGNGSTKSRK